MLCYLIHQISLQQFHGDIGDFSVLVSKLVISIVTAHDTPYIIITPIIYTALQNNMAASVSIIQG